MAEHSGLVGRPHSGAGAVVGPVGVGARYAVGIGAAVAGAELLGLGLGAAVPVDGARWAAICALAVALDTGAAALVALAVGAALSRGPKVDASVRVGIAVWLAALAVGGAALAPGMARLAAEDNGVGGVVLALVALGLSGGAGVGAALASRRVLDQPGPDAQVPPAQEGEPRRARPLPIASVGLGLAVIGGLVGGAEATSPEAPSEAATIDPHSPTVVLVSVDGLGVDIPFGLAALTAGGVRFDQAVSPVPSPRAANATLLVGLHPLRHRVLEEGDLLSRAYTTAFEVLAEAGWPTAAFVSSPAVAAGSGLEQGFDRYDDDWALLPRTALGRWIAPLLPGAQGRPAPQTAARFVAWAEAQRGPYAAWIHLDGADGVEALDAAAEAIERVLEEAQRADRLVLVVAGSHGRPDPARGAEGVLLDDAVHVPLAAVLPGIGAGSGTVGAQVRLMDAAPTLVSAAGVGSLEQSEGLSLAGYASGARSASLSCALVGQAPGGGYWLGVRNNGVKVVLGPGGEASLYELDDDPGERDDRAAAEPELVDQAKTLLAADRAALASICGAPCAAWRSSSSR
jgi:hypothetical protein